MTRSKVNLKSEEAQAIINHEETGLKIYLFIKESDGEGSDFYYMGKVIPKHWEETTQPDDNNVDQAIVNFKFEMEYEAREDILEYLMRNDNENNQSGSKNK